MKHLSLFSSTVAMVNTPVSIGTKQMETMRKPKQAGDGQGQPAHSLREQRWVRPRPAGQATATQAAPELIGNKLQASPFNYNVDVTEQVTGHDLSFVSLSMSFIH